MAQVIKTDGTVINVEPRNGSDFQLDELQKIVGGYIEVVWLLGDKIMVVNEEGKCDGLSINEKATELFQRQSKYFSLDVIVGDVLVCKTSQVK